MSQPPQQSVPQQQGQQPSQQSGTSGQQGQFQQGQSQQGPSQQFQQGQQGQAGGQPQLFPTRNYLPQEVRTHTIDVLNQVLADTVDLLTQIRAAHWNVRGPNFIGLHELFEEIAEDLEGHTDLIAERATALGGEATATARTAAATSRIPELPVGAVGDLEYVELLAERLAIHDASLGEAIRTASQQDDLDTADLLNEVSREISKNLWFLEAHLQTQPVSGMGQGGGGMGQQQGQPQQGQQYQQGAGSQQPQQFAGQSTGMGGQQMGGQQGGTSQQRGGTGEQPAQGQQHQQGRQPPR